MSPTTVSQTYISIEHSSSSLDPGSNRDDDIVAGGLLVLAAALVVSVLVLAAAATRAGGRSRHQGLHRSASPIDLRRTRVPAQTSPHPLALAGPPRLSAGISPWPRAPRRAPAKGDQKTAAEPRPEASPSHWAVLGVSLRETIAALDAQIRQLGARPAETAAPHVFGGDPPTGAPRQARITAMSDLADGLFEPPQSA
jgi:hypothetical protein